MKAAYYLHKNGDIIYKHPSTFNDIEGDLVVRKWLVNLDDRSHAWSLVLEALALQCNIERARELAAKWNLTLEGFSYAMMYLEVNVQLYYGAERFFEHVLQRDIEECWIWLANNPPPEIAGFV